MKSFQREIPRFRDQYLAPLWMEGTGLDRETLLASAQEKFSQEGPVNLIKAKLFAEILDKGRIALDPDDVFQEKVDGKGILLKYRIFRQGQKNEGELSEVFEDMKENWREFGAFSGWSDFSHVSPNSRLLLAVGFPGLLARVEEYAAREGLADRQKEFYEGCRIYLESILRFLRRLGEHCEDAEGKACLFRLAEGAPTSLYEAMELLVVYFFLHEHIGGARVRTLGRLDVLLQPFYERDLAEGRLTREGAAELLRFFYHKFWSAQVPYDMPFCLGGLDENGNEVTSDFTYLAIETYNEMKIYSPKIHIRVWEKTPEKLIRTVLSCIREGNSSFVFISDRVAMEGLRRVGIEEEDLVHYVPIGCYEPAVWGKEMGCTGAGGVNLAKAVEYALTGGVDLKSGKRGGLDGVRMSSYEDFLAAVKAQIAYLTRKGMDQLRAVEPYYGEICPDPFLSLQYDACMEAGKDVYDSGAKYNNTSYAFYCLASLVDSLLAVKKLVFEEGRVSLEELTEILKKDWEGQEKLRRVALSLPEKYGNGNPEADALGKETALWLAALVNNEPNGRGGVFKASAFSIDFCVFCGERTMATPDGRRAGEVLSKNLCAVGGMDKGGVTTLIRSVTAMDHALFPNGSVLDVVLHPSAVAGEEGLDAFCALVKTYFAMGGFALHGNVFDAELLKKAKADPDSYRNLQVRVCGWNAYFVNLSPAEQDAFILQAETARA